MPDTTRIPEFEPYTVPRGRRQFQNVAIPLMALAETLSTRGKSPGTSALIAGKSLRQQDLDEAQRRRDDYNMAMNRRLTEQRYETGQLGLETAQSEAEKRTVIFVHGFNLDGSTNPLTHWYNFQNSTEF